MRILIPTQRGDIHAQTVQRALKSLGHDPVLWYANDLPQQQTLSLELDGTGRASMAVCGPPAAIDGDFDVVWNRRPQTPILPDDLQGGDREFSQREWRRCMGGLWRTLAVDAFWVNPFEAAERANAKAVQLVEAVRSGLRTPPTLISSDPERIRSFLRQSTGEVVYKPFNAAQWTHGEGLAYLFTAVVDEGMLPDDDVLRLCPGIFQPRIAKDHELRVTFIGHRPFVTELYSQALDVAKVDWRAGTWEIEQAPGELPAAIEAGCRALMERLGLVFACFDFIVTPAGEHVFLELNQMGQFLWLEEQDPELLLLDPFCQMLIQGRPDYDWSPRAGALRFADFYDRALDAEIDALHVQPPDTYVLSDAAPESGSGARA